MRLLPDTNFLTDVLNGKRGRAEIMEEFIHRGDDLACCAINVAEVCVGLREKEVPKTEALLKELLYFPVSWDAAKLAGNLKRDWARQGQTLSLADTLIAAVCLTERLTLVTGNRKHFPMPELSLYPLPEEVA